jgi:hypothetical protein
MSMKLLLESFREYTQELLTEKKMDQVEKRFQSERFLKAVNKFNEINEKAFYSFAGAQHFKKYEPKSPQEIQETLTKKIPVDIAEKDKAEALDWMILSFIKTKDIDFHLKTIEKFYQIKSVKPQFLSKNDIYSIADSIELHEIVEEATPSWDAYNLSKESREAEKGMNLIYENDDWKVFIPENKGAAHRLGAGSEWCTAAIGLTFYEQYHKQDDPLIDFISKKKTFKKWIKEYNKETKKEEWVEKTFPIKYQFHYGSNQFMDRDDQDMTRTALWYELNDIVSKMENPRLSDDIKEKAGQYSSGFEKLPGGWKIKGYASVSYFDKEDNLHREDGPAFIEFADDEKNVLSEQWYFHGKKERKDDGPAETKYYLNGKPMRQKWFTNGWLGRKDDKPTIISYNESGKIIEEEWFDSDGIRNRKDGKPALIRADGTKIWYYNGEKHRFDGPAWEFPHGNAYFWMGNPVSKEKYEKHLDAYKHIPFEESLQRIIKEELMKILVKERKLGKPSSETNLGDWFKRKGAPGKKGGWVDCNTCRDGKCKPCGRQSGEKRSKYPRCRPTPSQCKGYKRRGDNLQKEE